MRNSDHLEWTSPHHPGRVFDTDTFWNSNAPLTPEQAQRAEENERRTAVALRELGREQGVLALD